MKPKPHTPPWRNPLKMLLLVLVVLLHALLLGCKPQSLPLQPAPVKSVQPLPLPQYARQPPTPSECLPTCLDGLTSARASWQTLLTGEASPDGPASVSTTPSNER